MTTSTANLTQVECAQRASVLMPESYDIELDLRDATNTGATTFRSTTTLRFGAQPGSETWVDLIAASVERASLNGDDIDISAYDGARLPVTGLAEHNELVVIAQCDYSRTGEGLHRFTDPQDDRTYLYTHFEPTDARRMFANFEQPDLKARYTMRVTAPADWVVRSGQPEVERDEVVHADGTRCVTVTFAPTPPLSTYITALAAGPYHLEQDEWEVTREDGSTQTVPLTLMCRRSMADHLEAEDIFEVTKQGLDFYDEKFRFPYPWGKYDQIFVPEYNLGAMENPGLVTFTENYLIRGRSTAQQRERRTMVIMHEMAHMWFGDLTTMRWWDGLWLKESFADLMGYHVCAAATKYDTSWVSFALGRKSNAYRADQLPSTHPIVATIPDLEAARQNFDGITYAKGASVIKQLMAYVGEDAFFAGAAAYFERHAFASTELSDLVTCLEESSGRDLRDWTRLWLQTSGISTLTPRLERNDDGQITRLTIEQSGVDASTGEAIHRPHRLRVGVYAVADGRLQRTHTLGVDVTGAETTVPEAVGLFADAILVNDDDLSYAKTRLDPTSLQTFHGHLSSMETPLSRGLVWSALWNATRDGDLPAGDFLEVVRAQMPAETVALLTAHMLEYARLAIHTYLPESQRDSAITQLLETLRDGLTAAPSGSDLQQAWARALAATAADSPDGVPMARTLVGETAPVDGLDVDQDLRWAAWTSLTAQDAATTTDLAGELRRDPSMPGRTACTRAKASRPTVEAKRETWERITEGEDVTNDELRALITGFTAPSGATITRQYADAYYASLLEWWEQHSQTMATIMASGLFPTGSLQDGQAPEEHPCAEAAATWLRNNTHAPAALRRIVLEEHDDLMRALRAQER